jgi:hypothetical protein
MLDSRHGVKDAKSKVTPTCPGGEARAGDGRRCAGAPPLLGLSRVLAVVQALPSAESNDLTFLGKVSRVEVKCIGPAR